uniref:Uncharacterized protein n=1 Tax=Rhizophora mucronata TaxID=61149 RepID=A0A2P2NB96_RHIMU
MGLIGKEARRWLILVPQCFTDLEDNKI